MPLVGELNLKSKQRYNSFTRGADNKDMPLVMVFSSVDHKKNEKGFQYVMNRVKKVAKANSDNKHKLAFVIVDKDDEKEDFMAYEFENTGMLLLYYIYLYMIDFMNTFSIYTVYIKKFI